MLAQACRTPRERTLFIVSLVFSSLVWLALVVTLVGLLYAPFIALGVVVAHGLFLAWVTGNGVRLGSRQLPELYAKVERAAAKLGLEAVPEVYVVQGGGVLNAFATKLFSRRFVILNAEILDACEAARREDGEGSGKPGEIDFIIGHELGHLALGHLSWSWLLWPARLVPLLGPAYSRACEYSCDACGHAVVEDLETSSRALALLAAGGRQARQVNLDAFVEQRYDTGGFLMAVYELNASHPYLSKRVAALRSAGSSGTIPVVGRNPLAYFLAPFFGFAVGGAAATSMMVIAVIGVLAAIAIPNFLKFQERARARAELGSVPEQDPALGPAAIAAAAGALAPPEEAALPEKVLELDLAREEGFIYTLDDEMNVVRMSVAAGDFRQELVRKTGLRREEGYVYFLDGEGDVVRMATGGLGGLASASDPHGADELAPPGPPPSYEARAWLKDNKNKAPLAQSRFKSAKQARSYVEMLYKAGAVKVSVADVYEGPEVVREEGGPYAESLLVELPQAPKARKKLLAICSAEAKKLGYEGCLDEGDEMYLSWEQ